ncbi:MAG: hypothetical protein ACO1N0_04045 [Fluviicola sp.]
MKYTEFTLSDYVFFIAYLVLFSLIAIAIYFKHEKNPEYRYFLPHFFWKVFMGFLMAFVYIYTYGGGDTTAYWQGSYILNNLFYESPGAYFTELFNPVIKGHIPNYYNARTGIPPVWIYNEPNSWFVCKLSSLFSFFTFNSYLGLNLFYSVITSIISWKFFRFLNSFLTIQTKYIAYAVLFIPTVGFWCTGIMKDSVAYSSLLVVIMGLFKILQRKYTFMTIVSTLIGIWFIFVTRSFLLMPIAVPFFIILIFRLNSTQPFVIKFVTRMVGVAIAILSIGFFINDAALFGEFSSDNLTATANTIYLDFQNNSGYTGKRYDLGISEVNSVTMISVIPNAILTTLYRPFLWEADNALMLINGVESSIFILLTIGIIRRKKQTVLPVSKNSIYTKDFMLFCVLFMLILAYFVGLTSGLYGVLARLKAPVLPFFLLFVFSQLRRVKYINILEHS